MADATGETKEPLRVAFDRRLKLEFHGTRITSDGGLLAYRELDDALGLTATATSALAEGRRGKNIRHRLLGLLRQAVYGRLAGYEDVNDAERLARDPAMRAIVGREGLARSAASGSEMGRFETEWLATEANLAALTNLSGAWIDRVHARRPPDGIILDNLAAPQPAVLRAPAGVGHFRYPDRPHRLGHCPTLRRRHVDLPQLADDLLGRVPLPRHLRVLHLAQGHTLGRTTSKGAGQSHT